MRRRSAKVGAAVVQCEAVVRWMSLGLVYPEDSHAKVCSKPAATEIKAFEQSMRVRFAPSPTGYLHIGSARTFIFNWLYARHNQGTTILRIDDTDVERNTQTSLRSIFDGLKWLDLGWDEQYK